MIWVDPMDSACEGVHRAHRSELLEPMLAPWSGSGDVRW